MVEINPLQQIYGKAGIKFCDSTAELLDRGSKKCYSNCLMEHSTVYTLRSTPVHIKRKKCFGSIVLSNNATMKLNITKTKATCYHSFKKLK